MASWYYPTQLDRIEAAIRVLSAQVSQLSQQQRKIAMALQDDVDELVAAVEENKTVAGSIEALVSQLSDLLKAQVTDPATQAALQGAIQALKANSKEIADAVVANTPAERT